MFQPDYVQNHQPRLIVKFSMVLLFLVLLFLGMYYSQQMPLNYDEGTNLMFGMLANAGYTPYSDIFIGIPPLGILIIQLGATFGEYGLGVRYLMLLSSFLGVSAIYWLVRHQAKYKATWTGILAAFVLSFYPLYFFQSTFIMTDILAVALALLSIMLVEKYRGQSSSRWLLLSGVVYGLSLLSKILIIFLPVIIGFQFINILLGENHASFGRKSTYIQLVKMVMIWGGGVLLVLALAFVLFDTTALYQQVIAFRLVGRVDRLNDNQVWWFDNGKMLVKAFWQYLPLVGGAILGILIIGRDLSRVWVWLVWLICATLFLFIHIPLRSHHLIILLPPLAALSSIGVTHLPYRFAKPRCWLSLAVFLLLMGGIGFLWIGGILEVPNENDFLPGTGRLSSVDFIHQTTSPTDLIVTDDPRAALFANRFIPPYLSETSHARVVIDWLSADDIATAVDAYNSPVLMVGPRFSKVPNLMETAQNLYALKLLFADTDGGHTITLYAIKNHTSSTPARKINQSLGKWVLLKGVDIVPAQHWQPGQNIYISTYWQTQQQMLQDYKIFFHIKDANDNTVFSLDHYPFELDSAYQVTYVLPQPSYLKDRVFDDFVGYPVTGLLPTRLWIPGNTLKETIMFNVPPNINPGMYTLEIGMYDPNTLERLPVQDSASKTIADKIIIDTVEVK